MSILTGIIVAFALNFSETTVLFLMILLIGFSISVLSTRLLQTKQICVLYPYIAKRMEEKIENDKRIFQEGEKIVKTKFQITSKWWFWVIIAMIVVIVSLAVPLLINESYKANEGYETKWNAADALSFYGSYLSFVGTIFISAVAIYQNHKYTKEAEIREQKELAIDRYVLFNFGEIKATFYDENPNHFREGESIESGFNGNKAFWKYNSIQTTHMKLEIEIQNIGKYVATNLRIADNNDKKIDRTNILHSNNGTNDKKYINCEDKGTIIIIVEMAKLKENKFLKYYLTFSNPFENTYSQEIIVRNTCGDSIIQIDTNCSLNIK